MVFRLSTVRISVEKDCLLPPMTWRIPVFCSGMDHKISSIEVYLSEVDLTVFSLRPVASPSLRVAPSRSPARLAGYAL